MTLYGILAGVVLGAAASAINFFVSKACMKKGTAHMAAASAVHMGVYIAVFVAALLLRNKLPFDYAVMMISAAIVMSLSTVVTTFLLVKPKNQK